MDWMAQEQELVSQSLLLRQHVTGKIIVSTSSILLVTLTLLVEVERSLRCTLTVLLRYSVLKAALNHNPETVWRQASNYGVPSYRWRK